MGGDYLVPVAAWLAAQRRDQHQLAELMTAIVDKSVPDRRNELEAIRDVVERFNAIGLVVFHHNVQMAVVTAQHRAGLRLAASGVPLMTVAEAVEPDRPLTILRTAPDRYAAWYLSALRLPAGASNSGAGGACGPTADEACGALREQVRAACLPGWTPDRVATHTP